MQKNGAVCLVCIPNGKRQRFLRSLHKSPFYRNGPEQKREAGKDEQPETYPQCIAVCLVVPLLSVDTQACHKFHFGFKLDFSTQPDFKES